MSDPIPLYSEHSNPCIQYLEFEAINLLHFDGKIVETINLYRETLSLEGTGFEGLDFLKVWAYKKTVDAEALYAKIDNELTDLVSFYQALDLYLSTPDVSGAPEIVWPERKVKPVKIDKPKRPKPSAKTTIIDPVLVETSTALFDGVTTPVAKPVVNNVEIKQRLNDIGFDWDTSDEPFEAIKTSIIYQEVEDTLDTAIADLRKKRRRTTSVDKKLKGTKLAQATYRKQQLGPAYVDDKPLYSAVKALATPKLAMSNPSNVELDELILTLDGVAKLSDEQRVSLRENTLRPRLDKFNAQGLVEAAIVAHAEQMDTGGKALAFLWLKLKHTYLKDDIIVMSQDQIAKFACISKAHAGPAMKVLLKLGAIEQISKARRNSFDATAAKYRRLV